MTLSKLNWLRAGVLGANDGIISIAVLLVTVVGVISKEHLLIVGISTLLGGAISMALGEYVSVAAQRDAEQLHEKEELTNPWAAAISSFAAFTVGALLPLVVAYFTENSYIVIASVYVAITLTTIITVKITNVKWVRPFIRNFIGGTIALAVGLILNTVITGV